MSSEKKMVCLRSSDDKAFKVSEEVISAASMMTKGMIAKAPKSTGATTTTTLPIPNVTATTLSRVLDYIKKHSADIQPDDYNFCAPGDEQPLARFNDDFIDVDNDTLIDLVHAAEYLNIQKLFDLTCKAVADKLKGWTIDEIRKTFGIVNDYTKEEEEEEEVRRENSWAFE
ncbi:SKP1-like protein 3 [Miscanthus floridulus]|uniref:SKP1-like protein 3 n=1 Tax=Miscanthus floridulus TaxID=154761 RepID=UPI0034594BB1